MSSIRVILAGAAGRMGVETARAIGAAEDLQLVAAIDPSRTGESLARVAGHPAPDVAIEPSLADAIARTRPDVLVDFTHPDVAAENARMALMAGVAPVVGTSGLSAVDIDLLRSLCTESGIPAMVVPNFAIGAVLMMKFSALAARWMSDVEIVEMHHDRKIDAPSGTATRTAEMIKAVRNGSHKVKVDELIKIPGVRGGRVSEVAVHSVRLPGLVAHQMVMFGAQGETLTIRHDSIDRVSFMGGVLLAVREVRRQKGLVIGLDDLLG